MTGVDFKQVSADEAGMRLDRWFKAHFPHLPHGRLQRLLRTGQIRIDGARAKANARLDAGQLLRIPPFKEVPDRSRERRGVSASDAQFVNSLVIYRDDDVLAVNKPSGLAVQGGSATHRHLDGMLDGLKFDAAERPRLVHRLDKDTSGVLILARTRKAASRLARAFKTHDVKKTYWALVAGVPRPGQGTIKLDLVKAGRAGVERVRPAEPKEPGALKAITDYAVILEAGQTLAWVALSPRTGRTHQVRVHMSAIGHPVIGDMKYGDQRAHPGGILADGLHLHARALDVPLANGKRLFLEAELPPHMRASFKTLAFDPAYADEVDLPWRENR